MQIQWYPHICPPSPPSQVYVRRGYIAYELNSLQHRQLLDGTCLVEFQFMLPFSHPNRYSIPRPSAHSSYEIFSAKLLDLLLQCMGTMEGRCWVSPLWAVVSHRICGG